MSLVKTDAFFLSTAKKAAVEISPPSPAELVYILKSKCK